MDSLFSDRGHEDGKLIKISSEMDEFEGYEPGQGKRVAAIADSLASSLNMASRDRYFLQQAALIHDIGEVAMGRDYIRSSRALSSTERLDLQRHPVIGEQEASRLGLPRGVQLIIRWHHEWWIGSGYPDALESEQIPLAARILRLADTYASQTAARPFRKAVAPDEAKKYLVDWAGIEFDPMVVKAFLSAASAGVHRAQEEAAVPAA